MFLESLDQRLVLTGAPMVVAPVEADLVSESLNQQAAVTLIQAEGEGTMMTSRLTIFANGQQVTIPANIGVNADTTMANVFTDTADGTLQSMASATLGDFFDIWRTDAGLAGNNPNAVLSPTQLLTNIADTSNTVQMFVNGQISEEFGNHVLQGGEEIILVYSDNPVVSLNTTFGSIVIELFEGETPGTVNNFLNYVDDGDYINSFFHRSADTPVDGTLVDFVIQGGGFRTTSTTFTSTAQFSNVPIDPPIQNEPGISNLRGTVAMAKTSDPNSATSQFFVNLNDANTFLDSPTNSGGFTVFGQVLDLRSSDEIAALPIRSNPAPYNELPVSVDDQLVVIQSIVGRGEISGIRFNDANRNGLRDSGESLIAGATVYLDADNNGVLNPGELTATTDANGRYLFQIDPGSYTVRAEIASGFSLTTPSPSDSYAVTVEIGREVTNRDFGTANDNPTANNSLAGFVYLDADRDGIRGTGEVGVPGAQITVTGAGITRTILTDSTGAYSFTGLSDGTYQIAERQPTALLDGTDSTTVPNAVVGNDQITTIVLSSGQDFAENNFGEMGIQSQYLSIVWFFASSGSPNSMLRETIAMGEEMDGDMALADTIRAGGTEVPDGTNSAPIANGDTFSVNENAVLTVPVASGVLNNDTDLDGDSLTAVVLTPPTDGMLNFSGNGSFTYTPDADFSGFDSFTYQASDGTDLSNQATVTITVNAVDVPNVFSLNENSPAGTVVGTLTPEAELGSEVVFEVDDSSIDPLLELAADDHFAGDPAASVVLIEYMDLSCPHCRDIHPVVEQLETDFAGELLVVRRHLLLFNTSTNNFVFPNSLAAARAAEAAARQGMFNEMVDLLFGNQSDWSGATDPSTFFNQYAQQIGLNLTQFASDQADPAIDARIQRDRNAGAALGIASTPTFFINGQQTANPNTIEAFTPLIQNELDATDDVFRLDRETGEITVRNSAALDFETTPSFTLAVNATGLNGAASTIIATINLLDVNDSVPVANPDSYTVDENSTLTVVAAVGVLLDDSDADNDTLTAQQVTGPANGSLTLNPDGSFTYVPNLNFNGTDTFTYTATDGTLTSAAATVTIAVNPVNSAPLTAVDSYTLDEDSSLTVNVADGVLNNDSDPEGSSLTAVLVEAPQSGTLSLNPDGSFTYTPVANFSATDAFTYAASDGETSSGATTVTLLVRGLEDTPVGMNDSYSVNQAGILNVPVATGVLVNDSDADADTLTALLLSNPANGTLTLNGNGSFSYEPIDSFVGTDTFTYQASDGFFVSNTVTVTITVHDINIAPAAAADDYSVDEDDALTVNAADGLLANDNDLDGDGLTISVISGVSDGTLDVQNDGSFTYTPDANFSGTDTFTYRLNDGTADSNTALVTITVNPQNDAPVATDDAFTAQVDQSLVIAAADGVIANDSDADADTLTAALLSSPANGTLALNGDGSLTYTPNSGFVGTDSFMYAVSDGSLNSAAATVSITVSLADLMRIRLEAAAADGTALETIGVGKSFFLNAFVEDIRPAPQGVFAAYFDVNYDANIASVDGAIVYSTAFANGRSGNATTPGLIDEVGAFTQSAAGAGEAILFSVPFIANAAGTLDLVIDAPDLSPAHDALLFGINNAIPIAQLDFISDSIIVTNPPSGEGEGDDLAAYAASADETFAAEDDWLLP